MVTTTIPDIGPTRTDVSMVSDSSIFKSFDGTQVTESENHPLWNIARTRPGEFHGDIGGDFFSKKQYTLNANPGSTFLSGEDLDQYGHGTRFTYNGPWLAQAPDDCRYPPYSFSSDSELKKLGTQAIALCSPTSPVANLSTFLGEFLFEGIPESVGATLKKLRSINPKSIAKAVSKDHLNLQFGWLPIFSDIHQVFGAILNAQKIIDQFDRDSGKIVRRGWKFPPETTYDIQVASAARYGPWTLGGSNILYSYSKPPKGQVMLETKVVKRRWFSGAFTYYLPPMRPNGFTTDQVARKIALSQKVLGLGATPDDVWNLLPWSWLVDWFSNIGDFGKNLDAKIIDLQVLKYGYMMEHVVSSYKYTLVGPYYLHNNTIGPVPPSIEMVSETKRRIGAGPYGFGLTYDGLSALQKSILVALGITHKK